MLKSDLKNFKKQSSMFSSLTAKKNVGEKNNLIQKWNGTESNVFIYTHFIIIQQFQHQPFPSAIVGEVLLMELTNGTDRGFFCFVLVFLQKSIVAYCLTA